MKSFLLILMVCTGVLSGCAGFHSKKKPDPPTAAKSLTLIGRIASLPPDRKFVLIQSYERWALEPGTILTTRGTDERTANLKVTGEKMGQFAAADVQSGTVELGDAVYSLHVPKPVAVPPAPSPLPSGPGGGTPESTTPDPKTDPASPPSNAPVPELPEPMPEPSAENVQKNI